MLITSTFNICFIVKLENGQIGNTDQWLQIANEAEHQHRNTFTSCDISVKNAAID
jgi:hypothetical protein